MNMNISTGGPHILFFERDASLMALLISEFQLAGYECHTARTAVEVFDAIARHPIRVLLVNMAQAAAGRREFWVALDAQRRGRGVQVFTYQCYNLAGYGPREADERSSTVAVDMEIDGMLGLMSVVERIRERIPATSAATGTVPRFSRSSSPTTSSYPSSSTQPVQTATGLSAPSYHNGSNSMNVQEHDGSSSGVPLHATNGATGATTNESQQSYTAKIRAVLYSDSRSGSANAPVIEPVNGLNAVQPVQQTASNIDAPSLQQLAYGQPARESRESGLAQLSRMVQEFQPPLTPEDTSISFSRQPVDALDSISSQALRASPIEDLPTDRANSGTMMGEGNRRADMGTRSSNGTGESNGYRSHQETATTVPLASIVAPMPTVQPVQQKQPASTSSQTLPVTAPIEPARPTVPIPAVSVTTPLPAVTPSTPRRTQEPRTEQPERLQMPDVSRVRETTEQPVENVASPSSRQEVQHVDDATDIQPVTSGNQTRSQVYERNVEERVQREEYKDDVAERQETQKREQVTSQEMALADIIQSLPASPISSSASSQPQVLNGRPMRSLGSVLIEGHLVPQSRLEVAQNIQHMLRGVDLRYELGEILLMFKLLTPDQLLAATLVSNGLISTQQITALGRIRQELHSIGLEYDLESLLILFRMLTPEQLREARTSWQS